MSDSAGGVEADLRDPDVPVRRHLRQPRGRRRDDPRAADPREPPLGLAQLRRPDRPADRVRQRPRDQRDPHERDRAGPDQHPSGRAHHRPPERSAAAQQAASATRPATRSCASSPACSTSRRGGSTPSAAPGASEFVIVLPQTDEHTGFLLAEQILTRMRRAYRERGFKLSASIGVAVFPKHASNVDELLQSSTAATNAAVALGSDRVVVYSPDLEGAIEGEGVARPKRGPGPARHRPQPRRGPRPARRAQRQPLDRRRRLLRDDRPRGRAPGAADRAGCASPGCCTTSARSGSPTRSSTSPGRSRPRSGTRCAATPRWPPGSSPPGS